MPDGPPATRHYRGVSPQARTADRRTRLLDAGLQVFGTTGLAGATVKQICASAGLTERYFYESFKNQPALFAAVYEAGVTRMRDGILAAMQAAAPEPSALTEAAMTAFFQTLQDDPQLARILLVEVYGSAQDLALLYKQGVSDFADIAEGIIAAHDLLPQGALEPGLMSTALIGAAIHLALRWHLEGYQHSVPTMVAHGTALLAAVPRLP